MMITMMKKTGTVFRCCLGFGVGISALCAMEAQAANSVAVNFKGNLILNPPCEITGLGNGPISVDFGDMVIRKITGTNYKQPVPYTLKCDASDDTTVALTFKGKESSFDPGALLSPENPNLGFKFLVDNYPIRINVDPMKFTNNQRPPIYAYPVINSKVAINTIKAGAFTASATLEASYP